MSVGGGEVVLEVTVDRGGRVTAVKSLRTTPPFTDLVTGAVKQWQFTPGRELVKLSPTDNAPAAAAIESKVVVAAVFRRPAIYAPTVGQGPTDVAGPSLEVAFPVTLVEPPHPPNAFGAGVVLVELRVDRDGSVADAAVVGSAPAHDSAALTAARAWKFRPARFKGETVETRAYILFGFPVPVTGD
jgi:TonB family protein